jgi:hypothetical protein
MSSNPKPTTTQIEVIASDASLRVPAAYANYARVGWNPEGFVLYFFQIPPDVGEFPEIKEQLNTTNPPAKIQVPLHPVAKVLVPPSLMQAILALYGEQHAKWLEATNELVTPTSAEPTNQP